MWPFVKTSPYTSVLKRTLLPVAQAQGYTFIDNEYSESHFGNAIVRFRGSNAQAIACRDRGFWSLTFTDDTQAIDDADIYDLAAIIEKPRAAASTRPVSSRDDVTQLRDLAELWRSYGPRIERLFQAANRASARRDLMLLREQRVSEFLKRHESHG